MLKCVVIVLEEYCNVYDDDTFPQFYLFEFVNL